MDHNDVDQQHKKSIQGIQKDLIEVKRAQRSNTERIDKLEQRTDLANVIVYVILSVVISTIIAMILISVTT